MFARAIKMMEEATCVGIFAHSNPDGDAMGSAYALKLVLLSMGKQAEVFLLPNADSMAKPLICGMERGDVLIDTCDLLVAVDCADAKRLGEHEGFFVAHPNTIAFDHHITHVPYAKETVMRDVSSNCELMANLFQTMGADLSKDVATNLYVGMVCDTGNFKYESTTADTLRTAASLLEKGIDHAGISKRIFSTKSVAYYTLMQTALERLAFYHSGAVCVLFLTQEDFEQACIDENEAAGIVTLPGSVEHVEVGVYIRKRDEKEWKVSLRSATYVDVAEIARSLGGGGHVRAAGYTSHFSQKDEILKEVLPLIEARLKTEIEA